MSLILEALKKSEAERRLGHAPTLGTITELAFSRRKQQWRLFVLAIVALISVVVAVAVSSVFFERPAPAAPVEAASGSGTVGSVTATAAMRHAGTSRPIRAEGSTIGTSDAVASSRPDPARPWSARAPSMSGRPVAIEAEEILPRSVDFASVERESTPVAPTDLDVSAQPISGLESAPKVPEVEPVSTPSQTAVDPAQADKSPQSMEDPGSDWVRVAYLPTQERAALPPLKVSMHVFAEIPSARFVLIDGRRLIEGDRINESLHVIEIRREGTVLEHKGRRLLLARP